MIKAEPGKYSYASAGAGTGNHLGAEMLKAQSGLDVVHVPYKGSTPSVVSVLSGDTLFSLVTVPSSLQHIESGGLRALAVTTPNRVSALPDLPTLVESGHDVEIASVSGILLPAGASADVVAELHEEFAKATETESVRRCMPRSVPKG
ncbi:MAG: tripartite tricarboxylate transporter substrate-binding protein [Gammaproteobacteria bacterium]|nr:tripartite tricarboxylate transporter substrate-binding protein [Gammaproteobacteria bacterium]